MNFSTDAPHSQRVEQNAHTSQTLHGENKCRPAPAKASLHKYAFLMVVPSTPSACQVRDLHIRTAGTQTIKLQKRKWAATTTHCLENTNRWFSLPPRDGVRTLLIQPVASLRLLLSFIQLPAELRQSQRSLVELRNYAFGDRKFGGNAQSITKGRWLHHTSFLWDYKAENMAYLKLPARAPKYRLLFSHPQICLMLVSQLLLTGYYSSDPSQHHIFRLLDSWDFSMVESAKTIGFGNIIVGPFVFMHPNCPHFTELGMAEIIRLGIYKVALWFCTHVINPLACLRFAFMSAQMIQFATSSIVFKYKPSILKFSIFMVGWKFMLESVTSSPLYMLPRFWCCLILNFLPVQAEINLVMISTPDSSHIHAAKEEAVFLNSQSHDLQEGKFEGENGGKYRGPSSPKASRSSQAHSLVQQMHEMWHFNAQG
eukprot:Gb_39004 [translate_table: standard]